MILTGETRKTQRKTCPSATLSTDPSANPGLRGEKPATNLLSYGTAASYSTEGTSYKRRDIFQKHDSQ
jgi:hypothetical protein